MKNNNLTSKDLMIGNLIQTNDGKLVIVSGSTIYEGVEGYFKPIYITEEWLIKLGAEKSVEFNNVRQYYLGEIKIEVDLTTGEMFWTNKEPEGWKPLKYVHTLQNIYFILSETGESLKYSE